MVGALLGGAVEEHHAVAQKFVHQGVVPLDHRHEHAPELVEQQHGLGAHFLGELGEADQVDVGHGQLADLPLEHVLLGVLEDVVDELWVGVAAEPPGDPGPLPPLHPEFGQRPAGPDRGDGDGRAGGAEDEVVPVEQPEAVEQEVTYRQRHHRPRGLRRGEE